MKRPTPWLLAIAGLCLAADCRTPPEADPQLPNPASVHCVEQGGTLRMQEATAGVQGICRLPDGRECDEWAFFRGECPEVEAGG